MRFSSFAVIKHQDICFKRELEITNEAIALKCTRDKEIEESEVKKEFNCKLVISEDTVEIETDKNYCLPRNSCFKKSFYDDYKTFFFTLSWDASVNRDGRISYFRSQPTVEIKSDGNCSLEISAIPTQVKSARSVLAVL